MVADRREVVARFGEHLATRFLEQRGASVIGRNVRLGRGEIDIHARIRGVSVAVEVKTIVARSGDDDAIHQFTVKKAATIRRYASLLSPPARRVDLVAITLRDSGADVRWVPFAG